MASVGGFAAWFVALSVLVGLVGAARAQQPQQPQQPAASSTHPVTQAFVQMGALSCAARINQMAGFLGAGDVLLFNPPGQPDQRLLTYSMGAKNAAGSTSYVSASFAPNQANGCGAVYDAVTWWPDACDAVAARQFANLKKLSRPLGDIQVLDGGIATKIFLLPAGKGCVSVKKESVL